MRRPSPGVLREEEDTITQGGAFLDETNVTPLHPGPCVLTSAPFPSPSSSLSSLSPTQFPAHLFIHLIFSIFSVELLMHFPQLWSFAMCLAASCSFIPSSSSRGLLLRAATLPIVLFFVLCLLTITFARPSIALWSSTLVYRSRKTSQESCCK